jgi:hypothetical protein
LQAQMILNYLQNRVVVKKLKKLLKEQQHQRL